MLMRLTSASLEGFVSLENEDGSITIAKVLKKYM